MKRLSGELVGVAIRQRCLASLRHAPTPPENSILNWAPVRGGGDEMCIGRVDARAATAKRDPACRYLRQRKRH